MSRIAALIQPNPQRLPLLDLCLASSVLCAWFLSAGIEVQVAGASQALKLVISPIGWRGDWALGPWLISIASLLLYYLRLRWGSPARTADLQERLQRMALFALFLCLVRLAALWSPLTALLPILTLLWTPHATWALALAILSYVHWPAANVPGADAGTPSPSQHARSAYTAIALGSACLLCYGLYALYFCQITMLHGDEGQYLRVTQSLLHDGDMDLANNLSEEQANEFHVREFAVHKAPGSPEGKVHSVHPIGLSIALLPAYWAGLELWQNPRLGAALFMVLLTSCCASLLFLWLRSLDVDYTAALSATLIAACTGPLFLFSNQFYPEIPALFIALIALCALARWQRPGGHYQPLGGRLETAALTGLTLLLSCLPFLHARYAPIGLLAGAAVLAQAWFSPQRRWALVAIASVVLLALYALISFHFAFSGDWMGPFRPGNAWEEGALDVATWPTSLPGHWLNMGKGLLNASPIFFFALLGWAVLARTRDRRILVVIGLYGATAATNGLHPDWGFGFCYPARFLLTALPTLVYGLAVALPIVLRQPLGAFLAALALAASIESVVQTANLTEGGYAGRDLLGRTLNDFYPFSLHFFPQEQTATPLFDWSFWLLLAAALYAWLVHFAQAPPHWRWMVGMAVAILPTLWGNTATAATRLSQHAVSPYMTRMRPGYPVDEPNSMEYSIPLRHTGVGRQDPLGAISALSDVTPATFINASVMFMPVLRFLYPGLYQLSFPDLQAGGSSDQISGHLVITKRNTVVAVSPYEQRISYPLGSNREPPNPIFLHVDEPAVSKLYLEYSGSGSLHIGQINAQVIPLRHQPKQSEEISHIDERLEKGTGKYALDHSYPKLPRGYYRIRYRISGPIFHTLFQRNSPPVLLAAYPISTSKDLMQALVYTWFTQDRTEFPTVANPGYYRPLAEGIYPPWQATWPLGDGVFELSFYQPHEQDMRFLLRYDGPLDLEVESMTLFRDTYEEM